MLAANGVRWRPSFAATKLTHDGVVVVVVRVVDMTLLRVGNEQYARTNHSNGLRRRALRTCQLPGRPTTAQRTSRTRDLAVDDSPSMTVVTTRPWSGRSTPARARSSRAGAATREKSNPQMSNTSAW